MELFSETSKLGIWLLIDMLLLMEFMAALLGLPFPSKSKSKYCKLSPRVGVGGGRPYEWIEAWN